MLAIFLVDWNYISQLQAVRKGHWKLHLALEEKYTSIHRHEVGRSGALLIDLSKDISENTNLAKQNPEIVAELLTLAAEARRELGEFDQVGEGQREAGFVESPVPLLLSPEGE